METMEEPWSKHDTPVCLLYTSGEDAMDFMYPTFEERMEGA
jgi:hypothetical protein